MIEPLNYHEWDNLVSSFDEYSFFHSSAWARVLVDTYNFTPLYLKVTENDTVIALLPCMEVKGLLPGRKCVSLPFSDYCGPLGCENIPLEDMYAKIIEEGKHYLWKYIEIRGGESSKEPITASEYYYHHSLELHQNEETMFSSFRNSTRRNIKKAYNEDVTVTISYSPEAVDEFYKLNCLTRKHHGLPPQPKLFFSNIYKHIIAPKSGFVVLAYSGETVIAGGVFFHNGEKALYKYGASNQKYNYLKANNAVMWEAIKWFSHKGFKTFSFGRTHPENKGLLQYKNGWGTQKSVINYYKYDCKKELFIENHSVFSGWYTTVFRKTPIPVLKFIGSKFYKYMG